MGGVVVVLCIDVRRIALVIRAKLVGYAAIVHVCGTRLVVGGTCVIHCESLACGVALIF